MILNGIIIFTNFSRMPSITVLWRIRIWWLPTFMYFFYHNFEIMNCYSSRKRCLYFYFDFICSCVPIWKTNICIAVNFFNNIYLFVGTIFLDIYRRIKNTLILAVWILIPVILITKNIVWRTSRRCYYISRPLNIISALFCWRTSICTYISSLTCSIRTTTKSFTWCSCIRYDSCITCCC